MTFRPLPVLTFFTLVSLGILLWLGSWQYSRFNEKMANEGIEPGWESLEAVTVCPSGGILVYGYNGGNAAWRVMYPLALGVEGQATLVTYEIVYSIEPPSLPPEKKCDFSETPTEVLEGIFVTPKGKGMFATPDEPENRIFYTLDPSAIREATGLNITNSVFEPRIITLSERDISRPGPNPFARIGDGDELPPQRHFGYAITWWGLAIALFIMYFVFHHSRGRLRFKG